MRFHRGIGGNFQLKKVGSGLNQLRKSYLIRNTAYPLNL